MLKRTEGFLMTYLFWSLCKTAWFFGGKEWELSMGKTREQKKEKEHKESKEKEQLLPLLLYCDT